MTDTITLPRSVLEQALNVLEMMGVPSPLVFLPDEIKSWQTVQAALSAALKQPDTNPVSEPVAWRCFDGEGDFEYLSKEPSEETRAWSARYNREWEPLYSHPQPQVEQEPVAQVVPCYTPSGKRVALNTAYQDLPIGTKLYTHQQPPRHPLTDQVRSLIASMVAELRAHRYCGDCYPENGWPDVNRVLADYAAFKRAHGIIGE